jgi:hypothetical protein
MTEKTRIMYIEDKSGGISGPARIGRVSFSKTGKTLNYDGMEFRSLKGDGFKTNYYNINTDDEYWISGCHKDGRDALYNTTVEIDEDVREEYWREIRNKPECSKITSFNAQGKY